MNRYQAISEQFYGNRLLFGDQADAGVVAVEIASSSEVEVFKRRVGSAANAWRLYVMDLATLVARPLAAETQFVDDQAEWLDNGHVLYAIQRPSSATSDVWVAPVDDSAPAHVFLPEAASPIVVR